MSTKFLTGIDLNSQRATGAADPTSADDLATKQYVDNLVAGLSFKNEVKVATTTNGTLASAYANASTIDGVTLVTGDRILLKDQTAGEENGIYTVNASGAPTRATDADTSAELNNATVLVTLGTVNADRMYTQTTADPVVNTDPLVWAQFGTGVALTAGNGISIASNVISAVAKSGGSLAVDSGGIYIDPTGPLAAKRYAVNVPTSTPATITHSLGTLDVIVQVNEIASGAIVYPDIEIDTTNTVILTFATAPSSGQYRVVVIA